jgi:hypothetical protein
MNSSTSSSFEDPSHPLSARHSSFHRRIKTLPPLLDDNRTVDDIEKLLSAEYPGTQEYLRVKVRYKDQV